MDHNSSTPDNRAGPGAGQGLASFWEGGCLGGWDQPEAPITEGLEEVVIEATSSLIAS